MQEGCFMLFIYYSFFSGRKRSVELCKREDFFKLVYRINNTRYSFQKNKLPLKLLKPQFIGHILSNFKSISKYQLLFHWKSFENIWSFTLYPVEAGETELIYSYFEKGYGKKCTRQSRKVLWVVLSSLFFKEIWKNGTRGHGRMFASAKGKQRK